MSELNIAFSQHLLFDPGEALTGYVEYTRAISLNLMTGRWTYDSYSNGFIMQHNAYKDIHEGFTIGTIETKSGLVAISSRDDHESWLIAMENLPEHEKNTSYEFIVNQFISFPFDRKTHIFRLVDGPGVYRVNIARREKTPAEIRENIPFVAPDVFVSLVYLPDDTISSFMDHIENSLSDVGSFARSLNKNKDNMLLITNRLKYINEQLLSFKQELENIHHEQNMYPYGRPSYMRSPPRSPERSPRRGSGEYRAIASPPGSPRDRYEEEFMF